MRAMMIGQLLLGMSMAWSGENSAEGATKGWPAEVVEIKYKSSADNTDQPALFYTPKSDAPKPLLVGLHTWGGDYAQNTDAPYAKWAIEKGWVFIHPHFRGSNTNPKATGSEWVVKDILSAVEYAKSAAKVDASRIYLAGVSGGGYGTLLMAGRAPEVWAGVSAWAAISDLKAWHAESLVKNPSYAGDIERSCGGKPEDGTPAEAEAKKRSPLTYLAAAQKMPVSINVGIHDGHKGSVPVSHSLNAFNALADAKDRLTAEQITWFTEKESVPEDLKAEKVDDPSHAKKKVLFRRKSGNVVLTVFEGGHEIVFEAALGWLEQQKR
ncbi:MAG: prolyl oligopeptidase family serine peptidase [Planctomycetes bacterium]|nr:prolyl oligopeptidase family serine peptidase [Planctomycetota bacterium]